MSDNSAIEWTDATWNPVSGCTKVSPGCDHCYAETLHERFHGKGSFATVTLHPERLGKPWGWRKPRRVFVNSMSDLFHAEVPNEFIAQVFAVMACAPQHTFQVLTKRHARMRSLLGDREFAEEVEGWASEWGNPSLARHFGLWPLPHVWLGVSVENQQWADIRIPALLETPAAVRFLSCEPLLGPVNLEFDHYFDARCGGCSGLVSPRHEPSCGREPGKDWGVDWVIVGGESGPGARPMHPDWARSLRDRCVSAGVPFLFKQWGAWSPAPSNYGPDVPERARASTTLVWASGSDVDGQIMLRRGKHLSGRVLDGRTWDEYPAVLR